MPEYSTADTYLELWVGFPDLPLGALLRIGILLPTPLVSPPVDQ